MSGAHLDAPAVRDAARWHWPDILLRLGIPAEALTNRAKPCPGCGGRDRFRFDDQEGRGTWICGGGGELRSGDGFGLLTHVFGWDFPRCLREVAGVLGMEACPRPIPARSELGGVVELEAAANRELTILNMTLGQRVTDRETAKARAFREVHPEWAPMPPGHWQREVKAVERLLVLLPELYGGELGALEKEGPRGEQPLRPELHSAEKC